MRDLKIKPGMDTPKAKQKNPAPKDAESILKKHMDERQTEKEPENRDPVHYATDRVEGNMRRGAAAAANSSRRMIKRYREKQRQGKEYVKQIYKTGGAATVESDPHNPAAQYDNLSPSTSVRSEAGSYPLESSQDAEATPPRGGKSCARRKDRLSAASCRKKRTAERCIAPPQPNCSGAMATPQRGNQGTSVKSDPVPKNGRPLAGASRTMRVRQVARTTQSETIIARRARAAAQRKAQWAMLRDATKDNGNTAKKLSRTAVQAVKTVGKGVASAGNSIPDSRRRRGGTGAAPDGDPCGCHCCFTFWNPPFQREPGSRRRTDLCRGGADQL